MCQGGLLPHFADEDTALRFDHTWVSDHRALRDCRPAGNFPGNLALFRAREQEPPDVMEPLGLRPVSKGAWADHLDGEIRIIDVPGGHYAMLSNRPRVTSRGDGFARRLGSHPLFSTDHQHKRCHA
jgi:hypothetical protein